MCYQIYHICKYCNNQYECSLENYICPTLNHDVDSNMCDNCRAKEKEDFKKALEKREIEENKVVTIQDWEFNK